MRILETILFLIILAIMIYAFVLLIIKHPVAVIIGLIVVIGYICWFMKNFRS